MIAAIIAWSARHRALVFALAAVGSVLGVFAARHAPLDALPDISDTQVVVATEWMGRSPDLVDDQVTWPLSAALLGTEGVRVVRGQSMFGMSFVYAIFADATPSEDARARVAAAIARVSLPDGVLPALGPDASGVGWVYQYALVDDTNRLSPADLRDLQDSVVRPALQAVEGVAEVASVGGHVRQVEVSVDPALLRAYGVSFAQVARAVARANVAAGGGALDIAGHEWVIRSRGEVRSLDALVDAPIPGAVGGAGRGPRSGGSPVAEASSDGMGGMSEGASAATAVPAGGPERARARVLRVGDVADVAWAPTPRRGVGDLDGRGEAPSGIVVARQKTNALDVITRARGALDAVAPALPEGVRIVPVYDRSTLILGTLGTLAESLGEELLAVSLVVLLFLGHLRTALVPVIVLPVAVAVAFLPMYLQGLSIDVMSVAGIAVAVGAMVDASMICVENVHVRLARWEAEGARGTRTDVIIGAMQEVGPSAFGSLVVIAVSFIPVFALEAEEGRLFAPLAWTKTWSMVAAALLSITLAPALAVALITRRGRAEEEDPVSRVLGRIYAPIVRVVVRFRFAVVGVAAAVVVVTIPVLLAIPSEFMPPLHEGSLLYMPSAPPGISESQAVDVLQRIDAAIASVPEVASVYGKMGRADTATDPAPLGMAEVVITLHPEHTWRAGMSWDGLVAELDARLDVPGLPNAWWMPVRTRLEMLSTGLRSPLGIKLYGPDLASVERAARTLEGALRTVPGTRSVVAERLVGANTLDVDVRRVEAAALGVSAADVSEALEGAFAGARVGEWVDGRSRFDVAVRYAKDFRTSPEDLSAILVDRAGGGPVPLGDVADVRAGSGPEMVRSEGGSLVAHVLIDPGQTPVDRWVEDADAAIAAAGLDAPGALGAGVRRAWAGTFESYVRASGRLAWMVPLVLAIIAIVVRANTGGWVPTAIVLLSVPFSLVGAVWLLWALDYRMSVAVWVGMIALAALDAETGVVMLLYLRLAWASRTRGAPAVDAIVAGSARRLRPKLMTVLTDLAGFVPVFLVDGPGADVLRRIAAPMVGGLVSSFLLELLVYPAIFAMWAPSSDADRPDEG